MSKAPRKSLHSASEAQLATMLTQAPRTRTVLAWLLAGYLVLLTLGIGTFLSPSAMERGNSLSWPRAIFASVNTITLTGFQQTIGGPNTMQGPARLMTLVLLVGGTLFALVVGGMAVVRILRLPYRDEQIIWSAIFCQAGAMLAGTLLLTPWSSPVAGAPFGVGAFQSAAALGNSGLVLGQLPGLFTWQTHLVLLPLAIVGGLGLPVLLEWRDALLKRRSMSFHARTVLTMTAALYLAGIALLTLLRWSHALHWADGYAQAESVNWSQQLVAGSAAAVVTRSSGLPYDFATLLPSTAMQFFAMALMFIGAAPGGTGGGVKVTTLVELIRGVRRMLTGQAVTRATGLALTWLAAYAGTIGLVTLLLLESEPQMAPHRVLFMAVSAVGCVGLSHDPVVASDVGLIVLSGAMLVGRLLPLAMLWWMAWTTQEADLAIG